MRPVTLAIMPENSEQKVADGWTSARQRDFTGGETLALLPEKIGRNQLIKMVNAIISPEGLITEAWQMDTTLFINVTTGVVVVPIPGSRLFTVYAAAGNYVVSFTFDPNSATPYDLANASGYPGYQLLSHAAPVTISGITHGTPFLGKNYCIAATSLYITAGQLTTGPVALDFGTVQTRTVNLISMTVTNTTAGQITLNGVNFDGAGSGSYGHDGAFPHVLAAAGTYTFNVVFNPTAEATDAANLNLVNTLGILQVPLTGTAVSMLAATPVSKDFGTVWQDSTAVQVFSVANAGGVAATVLSVDAEGDGSLMLSNTPALPYGSIIPAGGDLDISLTFNAATIGGIAATAQVVTDLGTVQIPIAGIVTPLPELTPVNPVFTFDGPTTNAGRCALSFTNPGALAATVSYINFNPATQCYFNGELVAAGFFAITLNPGQSVAIEIRTLDARIPGFISIIADAGEFSRIIGSASR